MLFLSSLYSYDEAMLILRAHEISPDLSALKMEEVNLPAPGEKEVRIILRATALNFPDLLMLQGGYQYKPPFPSRPAWNGRERLPLWARM